MSNKNSAIAINKEWWEKMAREHQAFTRPWLDLDVNLVREFAKGNIRTPPSPLDGVYPASILKNVQGKDVLCLASGGGQQSAVFGLLGAHVTVVDIADGQLAGDRKAAEKYGYDVATFQADMSDLSFLKDQSFDLVYQAGSTYVPDLKKVYRGVARVLKIGGLYRADAQNPAVEFVDFSSWDGTGYRITVPYAVKEKKRSEHENVIEFRHHLDEIFNGLIDSGFAIDRVLETPRNLYQENDKPKPGSWAHSLLYIPGGFAIVARKRATK